MIMNTIMTMTMIMKMKMKMIVIILITISMISDMPTGYRPSSPSLYHRRPFMIMFMIMFMVIS